VAIDPPACAEFIAVESAREMLSACEAALPADIFIGVAAVADWRTDGCAEIKIKKGKSGIPALKLVENPDILASISKTKKRPGLVIGFAAETNDVIKHAKAKRLKKDCDWIIANDVSGDVMGGEHNSLIVVTEKGEEAFPRLKKSDAARRLAEKIAEHFS